MSKLDALRPELPRSSMLQQIFRENETIATLVVMVVAAGLLTASAAGLLKLSADGNTHFAVVMLIVFGGLIFGGLLSMLQPHPRRALGIVPPSMTGLMICLAFGAYFGTLNGLLLLCISALTGLTTVPLVHYLLGWSKVRWRRVRFTGPIAAAGLVTSIGLIAVAGLSRPMSWVIEPDLIVLTIVAACSALLCWAAFYREFLEQVFEIVLIPFYRISGHGPGLNQFPRTGPVIVIANHSAWFDPLWLAKVLPRRLIPMMGSKFYDLPVMRFLMRRIVRAIRVEQTECGFRRQVPEIDEAIQVLDRGECLVIFPEGGLRRTEEVLLRPFGQGVWHILSQRPDTPVVVCWIEGGWGSFFSYFNGPPTKNKRMDRKRKIRISVGRPIHLESSVLANHRETRNFLWNRCLSTREFLEPTERAKPEHAMSKSAG